MYGPSKSSVSLLTLKKKHLNCNEINRKMLRYSWQGICPSQRKKKMFKRLNLKRHVSQPLLLTSEQETV